jgi:hypothetical protein
MAANPQAMAGVHMADRRRRITADRRCLLTDGRCLRMEEVRTDARCRLTAEDVQRRRLTAEAEHLLLVLEDQAVDSVAADRLVAEVTLPAVVAVAPQVVAAEDIAVAAVRTEAVTNRYFSPATYAVLRDGVFICPSDQALT